MNNFREDLKFSHECEDYDCWKEIYLKAFPTMVSMVSHKEDGWHQRAGIDRSITLDNAKQILVDEKARRRKDTGDIMLEYISNDKKMTDGWVVKSLQADYIAYAFIPSGSAYMLPVLQLQAAWISNREKWLRDYGTKEACNEGYKTLNCPVPVGVLFPAMGDRLRVGFSPVDGSGAA